MIRGDLVFADVGIVGHRGDMIGVIQQAVGSRKDAVTLLIPGE
jgi:hypothetical protein